MIQHNCRATAFPLLFPVHLTHYILYRQHSVEMRTDTISFVFPMKKKTLSLSNSTSSLVITPIDTIFLSGFIHSAAVGDAMLCLIGEVWFNA